MAVVYICTGACHGAVTEETYNSGKTTCGTDSCNKFDQPFEKRIQCESCEASAAKDGKVHFCEKCTA